MSERTSLFNSVSDSEFKSKFKTANELSALIRKAKREYFPGIPNMIEDIIVEDSDGICLISPDGMDFLELSMLIENKLVFLPGKARSQLAELRIFIPDKYSVN